MNAWNRFGAMLTTIACALLAASPGRATTPRALTLAEALVMAQRNDLGVVRADGGAQNARASVRSAWGAFLPNVNVSAGTTKQLTGAGSTRVENGQVIITSRQPWSTNLGASASLTIFDGGRRFFDMGEARANRVSAEVDAATARWQAALNTKQAFFNVLAARETGLAAAAQLEQAEQQRIDAFARTHAKAATRSDSLRAEISVRNAQLAVTQAATDLASADAALGRAVGSLAPVTAVSGDSLGSATLAFDDSTLAQLVEDAPSVRAARAVADAAREARKGAWSAYLPSVTASWSRAGNGTGDGPAWDPTTLDYSASLRFGLSFPLFDQFGREAQLTRTAVAVRDAEASLRDARLAARQSLTDGLGGFREATQRVASELATVDAADEDLRVQRDRYSLGGSTLLDVLSSQAALDQARRDLIRARYDQRVAKAQLEALVGRDL
ncbi:MAG TPA: TolC family protein [Methylomirabilota bacterium]|jgi:outer membrane protein|nr:TolC family protein [Methylomirabilota bacterium]